MTGNGGKKKGVRMQQRGRGRRAKARAPCRREGKEEAKKKDIHLARGQEGHACLEIGMR